MERQPTHQKRWTCKSTHTPGKTRGICTHLLEIHTVVNGYSVSTADLGIRNNVDQNWWWRSLLFQNALCFLKSLLHSGDMDTNKLWSMSIRYQGFCVPVIIKCTSPLSSGEEFYLQLQNLMATNSKRPLIYDDCQSGLGACPNFAENVDNK
jgi:hypothetical protein